MAPYLYRSPVLFSPNLVVVSQQGTVSHSRKLAHAIPSSSRLLRPSPLPPLPLSLPPSSPPPLLSSSSHRTISDRSRPSSFAFFFFWQSAHRTSFFGHFVRLAFLVLHNNMPDPVTSSSGQNKRPRPDPRNDGLPPVGDNAFIQDNDAVDSAGDDDDEEDGRQKDKKAGRRKIKIEFIQDKSRRHITFSKRKAGIMKKVRSNVLGVWILCLG